jgi:23S rRNA (uracil1939-C5)-methyltransferase
MSVIELELESMAHGGDAIGHHQGRAVFVPLGMPGDVARVRIEETTRRFVRGQLVEVIRPAAERVEPPCRYFGLCGGCQWQHIDYAAQLALKRQILLDQLTHLGEQQAPVVHPTLGMENPWGYRNHVQLQVDREGRVGFHALRTHDVVPVEACWITHALLDELWGALDVEFEGLRGITLRAGIHTEEQMVIFEGAHSRPPALDVDMPVSCLYQTSEDEVTVLAGDSCYHEELLGRRFQVSGPSFFQVNTEQAERMIEVMRGYLNLAPNEELLDAFCGVGTFGLSLANQAATVVGIESSPWAIKDALANQREPNVVLMQGMVEQVLPGLEARFDAVVLDPPRAGCAPQALEAMARCEPRSIVYASCDPATLARDVKQLGAWGYRLAEVQPIDLFPHSYHIEAVARFEREAR